MKFVLDNRHTDRPLYRQIADQVQQQIAAGRLVPGDELPPVRQLAQELGCTPGTVARAYAELRQAGLIVTRRGGGTRVAQPPSRVEDIAVRRARLVHLVERPLLEALAAGYTAEEVEAAFGLALARWRQLQGAAPPSTESPPPTDRLRFVGSHDPVVELLAQHMRTRYPDITLSVEFRGSLAGLMALAQGQADVAGAHLRSEHSDEYNVEHVRHILPGLPVVLVTLALREVGLIVAAGNPKGIHGIEDVARPDVRLVNRQRGSGTRVLLDARLRELDIDPQVVQGYDHEETTHLAVATAVAEGRADVGVGIRAAAESLGLGFLPLLRERYDLVIPARFRDTRPIQSLLNILTSSSFQDVIATLGGYDLSHTGRETLLE